MRSALTVLVCGVALVLGLGWVPTSAWARQSTVYARGVSLLDQGKLTEPLDALNQAIAEDPRTGRSGA